EEKERGVLATAMYLAAWTCPRCGTPAKPGSSLEMCANCGYCAELDKQQPTHVPLSRMLLDIPNWVWILLVGIILITGAAVMAERRIPLNTENRAVIGLAEIAVGLLMLLGAQVWAVTLLSGEGGFDIKDLFIFSGRLWLHTAQRLPATRWPVYILVWGL